MLEPNSEPHDHLPLATIAGEFSSELSPLRVLKLAVLVEGGMALAALLGGWLLLRDGNLWGTNETWITAAWGLGAGIVLALVAQQVQYLPGQIVREFCRFVEQQIEPLFAECTVWQLTVISLLAGLGEELLFRGFLQQWVTELVPGVRGWWLALLISGLAFGACHALSRMYFVLATLGGIYLGLVFAWTDSILAAVIAHASYDLFMLLHLRWENRKSGRACGEEVATAAGE